MAEEKIVSEQTVQELTGLIEQEQTVDAKKKSDLSRAFGEDGARKTHVGGQALLEGIMMRGRHNWAVAVREPDGGIYTEEHDLASGKEKNKWMYFPLVRGCTAMVEAMALSFKALEIAAIHAFNEEEEETTPELPEAVEAEPMLTDGSIPTSTDLEEIERIIQTIPAENKKLKKQLQKQLKKQKKELKKQKKELKKQEQKAAKLALKKQFLQDQIILASEAPVDEKRLKKLKKKVSQLAAKEAGSDGFGKTEMAISMVVGLLLGVTLFIVAPALITNLIVGEYDSNILLWNVVDGILRVAVFVFYLWLIGRMKDIKRMFGYHGAEHKTIHCYEHGLDLTPENARSFPRLHVRCGTAFLIMVMLIAILVYTIIPLNAIILAWGIPDGAPKLILVVITRILFLPVIAGLSYEITVKWAGARPENPLVKVILWPGMQLQYLTTKEPDDGQIDCAIAAMKIVLKREEKEARLQASGG